MSLVREMVVDNGVRIDFTSLIFVLSRSSTMYLCWESNKPMELGITFTSRK